MPPGWMRMHMASFWTVSVGMLLMGLLFMGSLIRMLLQ